MSYTLLIGTIKLFKFLLLRLRNPLTRMNKEILFFCLFKQIAQLYTALSCEKNMYVDFYMRNDF